MKNIIQLNKYDQKWYSRGKSNITVLLWWVIQGTLFRFSLHNMYRWRAFLLRLFGATIGKKVQIRASAKFTYPWKVCIGDYSWIGDNVKFYSLDYIEIGKNCIISQESYLCTGTHDLEDPYFSLITKPIIIKDGVWIATDVFIHPGVTVYEMAVVAARSNVTRDIPANKVFAGSPAKFVKERFLKY